MSKKLLKPTHISDDIVMVSKIICQGNIIEIGKSKAHRVPTLRGNKYVIVNASMPAMLNSVGFILEREGEKIFVEDSLSSIFSFFSGK